MTLRTVWVRNAPFIKLWFSVFKIFSAWTFAALCIIVGAAVFLDYASRDHDALARFSSFARSEAMFLSKLERSAFEDTAIAGVLAARARAHFAEYVLESEREAAGEGSWSFLVFVGAGELGGYSLLHAIKQAEGSLPGDSLPQEALLAFARAIEGCIFSKTETRLEDKAGLVVALPVLSANGSLVGVVSCGASHEPALGPLFLKRFFQSFISIFFLIVMPAGLLAGFAFAIVLRKRILPLRQSAEAYLEGDFSLRYSGSKEDEVGLLAAALERLGAGLPSLLAGKQERGAWEERGRIARELHDGLKQELFALKLNAGALKRVLAESEHEGLATGLEAGLGDALSRTQAMLGAFSPAIIAPEKLDELLKAELLRWIGAGLISEDSCHSVSPPGSEAVAEAAYWIAKEAIANAAKHGSYARVELMLGPSGGEYLVRVCDYENNGAGSQGFKQEPSSIHTPPHSAVLDSRLGLVVMRSRAREIGGSLRVLKVPDGFIVDAHLPDSGN